MAGSTLYGNYNFVIPLAEHSDAYPECTMHRECLSRAGVRWGLGSVCRAPYRRELTLWSTYLTLCMPSVLTFYLQTCLTASAKLLECCLRSEGQEWKKNSSFFFFVVVLLMKICSFNACCASCFDMQDTGKLNVAYFRFDINDATGDLDANRPVPFRLTPNISEFLTTIGVSGPLTASMIAVARCFAQPNFKVCVPFERWFYCLQASCVW